MQGCVCQSGVRKKRGRGTGLLVSWKLCYHLQQTGERETCGEQQVDEGDAANREGSPEAETVKQWREAERVLRVACGVVWGGSSMMLFG